MYRARTTPREAKCSTPYQPSLWDRIAARASVVPPAQRHRGQTAEHTVLARRTFSRHVQQQARVLSRLLRLDPPTLWRLAAHGAVLVLTLGVFCVTRYAGPHTVEASGGRDNLVGWADRVEQEARDVLPQPVLGTEPLGNAVVAAVNNGPGFISTGLLPEADATLLPWDEPERYVVKAGDTITGIAAAFNVDPETVLYANPDLRANPHSLSIGQEITILPINGVLHIVKDGDTLQSIADTYKAKVQDILDYTPNGLSADATLVAGTEVVVPGGQMDIVIPTFYEMGSGSGSGSSSARTVWVSDGGAGPVAGTGSFYAATYGVITQRFCRWHRAVDIANHTGTPIYAIDSGTIEVAGWYGWAGNAVIIDHGNGFESLYAHMSAVDVSVGQTVQRGQIVGAMGCTHGYGGRCTGPHLHIELYYHGGSVNPCAYGACP